MRCATQESLPGFSRMLNGSPVFAPGSRYDSTPSATYVDAAGRQFQYKKRRLLQRSSPEGGGLTVGPDERVDRLAFKALGNPLLFWHLCDVNAVIDPNELVKPGRLVRVTGLGPGADRSSHGDDAVVRQ